MTSAAVPAVDRTGPSCLLVKDFTCKGRRRCLTTGGQVSRRQVGTGVPAQRREPLDLAAGERPVGDIGQRQAAPQSQSRTQQFGGIDRMSGCQLAAAVLVQPLEYSSVRVVPIEAAIGLPVQEPNWPDYAGPRRYVVPACPPWSSSPRYEHLDLPRMVPNYDIQAIAPDEQSIIIVSGTLGEPSFTDGEGDWWAVPELAHLSGIATTENNRAEVAVEISGMAVHLCGFRSARDAVHAALSLHEYRPQNQ